MSAKTVVAILARERRTRGEPEKPKAASKPVANPLFAEKPKDA